MKAAVAATLFIALVDVTRLILANGPASGRPAHATSTR